MTLHSRVKTKEIDTPLQQGYSAFLSVVVHLGLLLVIVYSPVPETKKVIGPQKYSVLLIEKKPVKKKKVKKPKPKLVPRPKPKPKPK
ncbi:MAG: hypothetical protein ACE5FU_11215, partial [Nitrospinota bacterium]